MERKAGEEESEEDAFHRRDFYENRLSFPTATVGLKTHRLKQYGASQMVSNECLILTGKHKKIEPSGFLCCEDIEASDL
jgi:hypothetical protein